MNSTKFLSKGALYIPQLQHVRHNMRLDRAPHDRRRLFMELVKPIYVPDFSSPQEKCEHKLAYVKKKMEAVNLYEEFLVKKCKQMISENRMLAICQNLQMRPQEMTKIRNKLINNGMDMMFFQPEVIIRSFKEMSLGNLLPFMAGLNLYPISREPAVGKLIKVLRKIPQLILLGGRVDNYILAKEGLLRYAKLSSLDAVRGQLTFDLVLPASRVQSLLGNHQQTLAQYLDQHVRQSEGATA